MSLNSIHKKKDPQSIEWFYIDWADWLAEGDSISEAEWSLTGGLVEVDTEVVGTKTKILLSGGTLGEIAKATVHIVTTIGEENDQRLNITIVNK